MKRGKENSFGLYSLALERLREIDNGDIIRFPVVFEKLCSTFCIKKEQAWELLFLFRDFGFVEIVKNQGIRVKDFLNYN